MPARDEKLRVSPTNPTGDIESPYLAEDLFVGEVEADWEPRLSRLESESSFRPAFEHDRTIPIEPEELEEEFVEDDEFAWERDELPEDEAEAQEEAVLSELEDSLEDLYEDEETLYRGAEAEEEEDSYPEDTLSLEEEPLLPEEVLKELEEEGPAPVPDLRKRIVEIAKQEWSNWEQGNLSETDPKATPFLLKYWMNYRPRGLSQETANKMIREERAWSAVFISYVMREAGAGNAFTYSATHTNYIAPAKKAAENQDSSKFQAYDISSVRPEVGDLVCRDRAPRKGDPCTGTNFDNVDRGGISHSDIVVDVKPEHIVILGGNTAQTYPHRGLQENTVGQRKIRLDRRGLVVPEQTKGACRYFAIVKPPGVGVAVPSVPTVAPVPRPTPGAAKPPAELVRFAQRVLNAAEGERLALDGDLGPLTRGALERFCRKYNLGVSGVLDDKTQLALAQRALEEIRQQSLFGRFGVLDAATRRELIAFKSEHGLRADDTLDAATRTAVANALEQHKSVPTAPAPVVGPVHNWAEVDPDQRMLYVVKLQVEKYQYPVNGAAGLVGNLWAESGVIPNRVEGSSATTPMRARDFNNVLRDLTVEEVMNRNPATKVGPLKPGVGIAQWTSRDRRAGLFQHTFQGERLGAAIVYNMDAQVDYLVTELGSKYISVDRVLKNPNVSLEDASDEVVYNFEIPGSMLTKSRPRRKLPRTDPVVQNVFDRRRRYSRVALRAYRRAHPAP